MRAIALLAIGFMASTASAGEPAFTAVEQQVIAASQAQREAFNRRDLATMQRLIASDCLISDDDGVIMSGPEKLFAFTRRTTPDDEQNSNFYDYHARTVGDVVVLSFHFDDRERRGTSHIVTHMVGTEIWTRRSETWVMIAKSGTDLPPVIHRHITAIAVDAHKLAEYVGRYDWGQGQVDEVSVQGDHLVSRMSGGKPDPAYFVAPDVSVQPDDAGDVVFQRDRSGKVTGYIYYRTDGQKIRVKKLP